MTVTVMATTRGRLSPATPLLSLTTPLEDTATTSTVPATPTLRGLPRVFTRGRLPARATTTMPTLMRTVLAVLARGPPMATPPLSLTTPLEDTATTSTVPAPLTPTGAPRVFTRGRLSPATPLLSLTTPL